MKQLIFALSLLTATLSKAQSHSCDVNTCKRKTVGKYQIEVTGCQFHVDVTVYDKKNRMLANNDIVGYAGFYYPDNSYLTEELELKPNTNTFTVRIPYPGFHTFKISLIIDGQSISADFENDCNLRAVLQK